MEYRGVCPKNLKTTDFLISFAVLQRLMNKNVSQTLSFDRETLVFAALL